MQTKTTSHSVYNLNYHIVFVTKYRRKAFTERIEVFVKEQVQDICIAKTIKSILTVAVFKQFAGLKKRSFWGSGLFSDGCYYGSAGTVSSATIQRYIENQKTAR